MNGYRVSFATGAYSLLFEYEFLSVAEESIIVEFDRVSGDFMSKECSL